MSRLPEYRAWPMGIKIASAEWRHLLYLNYRLPPDAVQAVLPSGVEVDMQDGSAWLSWVGKLVQRVRVLGIHLPDHQNYASLSAHVYVRSKGRAGIWRLKSFVPQTLSRKFFSKEEIEVGPTEFSMHFEEGGFNEVMQKSYSNAVVRYSARDTVLQARTSGLPVPVNFDPDDPFFLDRKAILGPGRAWHLEFPSFFLWEAELMEARLPSLALNLPEKPESVRLGKGFQVKWRS